MSDQQRTWTYAGVRVDSKGKLAHAWLDDTGAERWYGKLVARVVGGSYAVTVTDEDKVFTKGAEGPQLIEETDHEQRLGWEVASETARIRLATARRESSAAKMERSKLAEILDPIADEYQRLHSKVERVALIATVIDYIERGA